MKKRSFRWGPPTSECMEQSNKIILFQDRKIRRIWLEDDWHFSVIDIVGILTDSTNPRDYWYKMKIRVKAEDGFEPSTVCRQFKMEAPDGKQRKTDCANTEGILRIIQSIPSPKAEPFKRWLAKVGYERVGEKVTTEISEQEKPDTFTDNKKVAKRGGAVAGNARKDTEKELGRSIVSEENYLSDQLPNNRQNKLSNK